LTGLEFPSPSIVVPYSWVGDGNEVKGMIGPSKLIPSGPPPTAPRLKLGSHISRVDR